MKWKTAAFFVLLIFTVSAFVITSTVPVFAGEDPEIDTYTVDFGGDSVQPLGDPVPGGGPGGD
jgi:hypothetical protein